MSLKFKGDKVKKKKRSHRDIEDPEDRGEGSSTGASAVRARYGKDAEGRCCIRTAPTVTDFPR